MLEQFRDIKLDSKWHTYTLNGKRLMSVSKILGGITPPFERDLIAARTAAKMTRKGEPTTAQQLIEKWEAKAKASLELGTKVHKTIAGVLSGVLLDYSLDLPELSAFNKFMIDNPIGIDKSIELVVGDTNLFGGIGGTLDLLYYDENKETYHIIDWKTGNFELENEYGNLLSPFDHLTKSEYNKYSIQLGLYKLILKRNTDFQFGDSYIVHLGDDGQFATYKALELDEEIKEWSCL